MHLRRSLATAMALVGILGSALSVNTGPASATPFAGSNGKIVFHRDGANQGIYIARRDGSVRPLTRANDAFPRWSPDGRHLAVLRYSADFSRSRIVVMRADGTDARVVSQKPEGDGCMFQPPHWSFDGLFLVYSDDCFGRETRVAQLRIVAADGSAHRSLTDYSALNHFGEQPWSPILEESARLVFTSDRDGDLDVYVMDSDGGNITQLTNDALEEFEVGWSPLGDRIVFAAQVPEDPFPSDIVTVNVGGEERTTIVTGDPQVGGPAWSPDGSKVLFTRYNETGFGTHVIRADGSDEQLVSGRVDSSAAAWAPDSNAVVFQRAGDIFRWTQRGTGRVTTTKASENAPDWQPRPL